MNSFPFSNRGRSIGLAVIALILAGLACGLPFRGGPAPTASNTPAPQPSATATQPPTVGDYGDAPDGDRGLDSGYYAPVGGPFLFTYQNAGVGGNFPTMGDDPVPGAYTLDVDEFWIGPLYGPSRTQDIPSREDDADDPNDPDTIANLDINAGASDCDAENGSHNPAASGCQSVPAYSMPMNARLTILFGQPPLGIWITSVTAHETMGYSGPVYWNLLFDLDQDGAWDGPGEWIARDVEVDLGPGETETLISPAFQFPTSGAPFGRLNFPYWVRSMVTSESVQDVLGGSGWDGRGPENGFAVGEVEDYFVEWQPIGKKYPDKEPAEAKACTAASTITLDQVPTDRTPGDLIELLPGEGVREIQVFGLPGPDQTGPIVPTALIPLETTFTTPLDFGGNQLSIGVQDRVIQIQPEHIAGEGARVLVIGSYGEDVVCSGAAPVYVNTGQLIELPAGPPPAGIFGRYSVSSTYSGGDKSHDPFVLGTQIESVTVSEGSIVFSGEAPFVTVTGERNEDDGTFSAVGEGLVAGYNGIAVVFKGTLRDGQLSGKYTYGAEGGLPGGESITYAIEGSLVPPGSGGSEETVGPLPVSAGVEEAVKSFIEVFNTAAQDRDPELLYGLLHPAVLDRYGQEACRSYLETGITSAETPVEMSYGSAEALGTWEWQTDGLSTSIDYVYRVQVQLSAGDQSASQQIHLAVPGDDSVRWFTDCGVPAADQ
jgi:hypothetical protein